MRIIKEFLLIENLYIQVSTNLFRLANFEKELKLTVETQDIKNLSFNISYHYFEYIHKIDTFIKSIIFLRKYWFQFHIKFLLPNKNISLINFLSIRDKIIKETEIQDKYIQYDLIINTIHGVSKSYSQDILDFFYNKQERCHPWSWMEITYKDNSREILNFSSIRTKWLNKFKWFKCFYVSEHYTEVNISHKGYITFGPCNLLNNKKFTINNLIELLASDKYVLCTNSACSCWINLKKEGGSNFSNTTQIENILSKEIRKSLVDFDLINVGVSIGRNINIDLKYKSWYIFFYIEKDNRDTDLCLINYIVKNEENIIVMDISTLEDKILFLIENRIKIFAKFYFIFHKILFLQPK